MEKWLEVLGCGVTEQEILKRSGRTDNVGWAFGLGLERLAMVLFEIPDIRLFWSTDQRFTSQFPPCYKDMSFWINDAFTENNLCEVVRGVAGDLVEERPATGTTAGGATVAAAGRRDGTRPATGHITHRLQSTLHKILPKFQQHLPCK
ncbi:hypothetical protein ACLOJK_024143 [Asimina triloba]